MIGATGVGPLSGLAFDGATLYGIAGGVRRLDLSCGDLSAATYTWMLTRGICSILIAGTVCCPTNGTCGYPGGASNGDTVQGDIIRGARTFEVFQQQIEAILAAQAGG